MSDISTIIENYSTPSWGDFTALNTLAELDWVEKKGGTYADEIEGNANNLSYTASDQSTATYVSTITYDTTDDYYYPTSVSFTLKGADKTSFKVTQKKSKTVYSQSIAYSAGLGTKDKTDDVTFTNSYTRSYTSTSTKYSANISYKDGLGNNLNNSYSEIMNKAGTSGTFSDTYTLSATDALKNKITGGFIIKGTIDDSYNYTTTSTTITAGSATLYDGDDSITGSWTKIFVMDDSEIDPYSISEYEATDFPVTTLFDALSTYLVESANTITISSPSGTGKSFDAAGGNDIVTGGIGDDSIIGGSGNDKITGSSGADIINGDVPHSEYYYDDSVKGNDTLIGGDGDDQLDGGYGNDSLSGGNGNDLLYGAGGTDTMTGEAGDDILVAYQTKDKLTGGAGSDTFVFYNWANTAMNATITDFQSGTDFLDVECSSGDGEFDEYFALDSTNFSSGKGLTSSKNSSVFVYDTSNGNLYFDADGSSSGKGLLIVTLTGKPTLSANDFKVVDLSGYELLTMPF
jgi:Ca2+-binding RTX toxin-like protein